MNSGNAPQAGLAVEEYVVVDDRIAVYFHVLGKDQFIQNYLGKEYQHCANSLVWNTEDYPDNYTIIVCNWFYPYKKRSKKYLIKEMEGSYSLWEFVYFLSFDDKQIKNNIELLAALKDAFPENVP